MDDKRLRRLRREEAGFTVAAILVAALGSSLFAMQVTGASPVAHLRRAVMAANPQPNAQGGAIEVQNTATLVPATSLNGREGVALYNLGPATIYCGFTTSVTTATGFPIPSNGSLTLALAYNQQSSTKKVYCIAAAAQTSPADTRWVEIL